MSSEAISQSEILRKNITAIAEMHREEVRGHSLQDRIADLITEFSGSMLFVGLHAIWFGAWILMNLGVINIPRLSKFDPFPFGLLTMIVSLEAIFLSTFVLISQNRSNRLNERRAELDLHVNLLAEQKTAKLLDLLDTIARQLNSMSDHFHFTPDPEVDALKVSPDPQDVLAAIEGAVKEEAAEVKREVETLTSETQAVREDMEEVSEVVEEVATDVREIKEEIKAK